MRTFMITFAESATGNEYSRKTVGEDTVRPVVTEMMTRWLPYAREIQITIKEIDSGD